MSSLFLIGTCTSCIVNRVGYAIENYLTARVANHNGVVQTVRLITHTICIFTCPGSYFETEMLILANKLNYMYAHFLIVGSTRPKNDSSFDDILMYF